MNDDVKPAIAFLRDMIVEIEELKTLVSKTDDKPVEQELTSELRVCRETVRYYIEYYS